MAISNYYLIPPLQEELKGLAEIALDLRWSWSHTSDRLWEQIDPDIWDLTRNPWLILQSVSSARLKTLARDESFMREVQNQVEEYRKYFEQTTWFSGKYAQSSLTVAYFSMEFGLSEALPIYSGGLGILAGDMLKTASDLGVPVVGIGLLYQQGYFRQTIDAEGEQIEYYPYNDPSQLPVLPVYDKNGEWLRIDVSFPGRCVKLRVWQAKVGRVSLYLLDSNDPENGPADQCITSELYGGGAEMRLQQEIVLGIGGWRLMEALGIQAELCHLNEGHAALAVIERIRSFMKKTNQPFDIALTATRAGNIFTTHTPVEAGFDRFSPALAAQYLRGYAEQLGVDLDVLLALGRQDPANHSEPLNMAYLAVRGSRTVNGVSRLHGQVSRHIFRNLFPRWPEKEIPIDHVTNGVHMPSWDSAQSDALWHQACSKERWLGAMETIEADFKLVTEEQLWDLRNQGCRELIRYTRERLARQKEAAGASRQEVKEVENLFNPDTLTMGFARRFAEYKRPNLLLHDPDRLARLLRDTHRPVQLIIAGKAHPRDNIGKSLIRAWFDFIKRANIGSHVIFLADYDMSLAERLVQGVDLWINTPRRPWEASGTSGMKVLVNGGLNLSELDGWWAETYKPQVGWALGDGHEHGNDPTWDAREAEQLYRILENEVIPAFYNRDSNGIPRDWVSRMKTSMAELTPRFSTNRMLREYVEKLYLPALSVFRSRSSDSAAKSVSLCRQKELLQTHWAGIHFGNMEYKQQDGQCDYKVPLFLNGINPENVTVQLYAESQSGGKPEVHTMTKANQIDRPGKGYFYTLRLPVRRNITDYTPRVVPILDGVTMSNETNQILWKE